MNSPTKRIIVADDEAYIRATLSTKLKQAGHDVSVATDGADALSQATQHPPDLVVTDFQMPGLSGYEMAVQLKEQPSTRDVPVIMITARGHILSPEELARTNIKHLLSKPFSSREVLTRVSELLDPPKNAAS